MPDRGRIRANGSREYVGRVISVQPAERRDWRSIPHSRQTHDGLLELRSVCTLCTHSTLSDSSDYVPLVNSISVYFQIRDDYQNLQSTEYENNKGYCEDLTEGKFSFPVVHGVRADPSNRQILSEHPCPPFLYPSSPQTSFRNAHNPHRSNDTR